MLTAKQNFLEAIRGGKPERYVRQFEATVTPYTDPFNATNPMCWEIGTEAVDFWGVTWAWPEGTPGAFPVHTPGKIVLEDIEDWKNVVKAPPLEYSEELWEAAKADYAKYDRNEYLVGPCMFPGLFECTHNLMGIENALCAFYTNPDEMHELINFIVDWEIAYLKQMAEHLHPELVLHHDDWGSSKSTFLSPEMFKEFYLEPYKRLYKAYKDNGFKIIVHHSDSYAANYVPFMIEMGVDVWQGGTVLNDIPALVKQYGGQISFMTGIDSQLVDVPDWSREKIAEVVSNVCHACGTKYFIPCQTQGADISTFPEVYGIINEEIDRMSKEMF